MFFTGDMASQGAFDLHDLINIVDLHLKPGGTQRIMICHQFILFESRDLNCLFEGL